MSQVSQNPYIFTMPDANTSVTGNFTQIPSTSQCTFPVTVNSSPSCILQAFQQSGYFAQLTSTQQQEASSDPAGWLAAHPYLYSQYPDYFVQLPTTSGCTFPVTVNSPANCILDAFQQSGYFEQLTPTSQQEAEADPAGWLASHPYLYTQYPNYFAQ